jgi:CobQ-like glutamine amidotransferase family enzyme
MNKLRLFTFLLLAGLFIIESCKKDTIVGTSYTTKPFQANINGSVWAPDTISNTITYSSANSAKTFTLQGTKDQKQIIMTVILNGASNTPGFTIGTYNVDTTSVIIKYNTQVNSNGQYVFLPHGTVSAGSGIINITAVDSVKKQITGTFNFYSRSSSVDSTGNTVINIDNILGGEFTSLPYTFTSN